MKKLNRKGFTLVELLAVIVVLAFVMVLAAPSVLSSMNSARQSSFMLYAEKMLNSAQTKYQSDQLIQLMDDTYCYNLSELTDSKSTQYSGFVMVTRGSKPDAKYTIQMFDKTYSLGMVVDATIGDKATGVTFEEVERIKAKLVGNTTLKGREDFFKADATGKIPQLVSPCESKSPKATTKGAIKINSDGTNVTS